MNDPQPIPPAVDDSSRRSPIIVRILVWIAALGLATGVMIYQRATGPTYPYHGEVSLTESTAEFELIRTHETTENAQVYLPLSTEAANPVLHWRRYPTSEEYTAVPMERGPVRSPKVDGERMVAEVPKQGAAGKIEYRVELETDNGMVSIPNSDDYVGSESETVVMRYKDPVPDSVLIPHVCLMILTFILGMRAGLAALFTPESFRFYTWTTLGTLTVGGMTLGPIMQKYAFGEYWTGFPFASDWTDNKTLVAWVVWILACSVVGFSRRKNELPARLMTVIATATLAVCYMIPHSMGGSELDYESGTIETGIRE